MLAIPGATISCFVLASSQEGMHQHIAAAALGQPQRGIAPSLDALGKGGAVRRAQHIHRRPHAELSEFHHPILIRLPAPFYLRPACMRQERWSLEHTIAGWVIDLVAAEICKKLAAKLSRTGFVVRIEQLY